MSRTRALQALASRAGLYVVLLLAAALFVLPGLWMVTASLNSNDAVFSYPPRFFPTQWNWENYRTVFEVQPFARQYLNSLYIAVLATAGTVLVSTMAGYALARFRFRGRNGIFLLLISGILIPEEVTVVPLYRIVNSLGLIDTHWPLIVLPIFSGGGVIATFIMRQAFLSLPKELEDAARLDGLGRWGTYWRVAVPLVRPTVAVVVILSVYNSWNMFLEPLIFLRTPENFTLPLVLTEIEDAYGTQLWNVQMAATTLSILAVLVVFVAAQRHVIAGLTAGSVKG
ncbi:carbohydrate ABC transporter permease [Jiangella mangrovi]|uniref:Multiple sugar transport system permease protein n=1 Tax=Jiangella mangrovi TaxID=1524084 RepID=A0A7W9GWG1_9ACTN|nr:carbohydrate ABC transporter permease [Jiangella mangrovi]MBB5791018.1 multiple sugar transport system permease protein [Jiangella mangrovi]